MYNFFLKSSYPHSFIRKQSKLHIMLIRPACLNSASDIILFNRELWKRRHANIQQSIFIRCTRLLCSYLPYITIRKVWATSSHHNECACSCFLTILYTWIKVKVITTCIKQQSIRLSTIIPCLEEICSLASEHKPMFTVVVCEVFCFAVVVAFVVAK